MSSLVAFSPVVAIALHRGISLISLSMSVDWAILRKLSEALSRSLYTASAVSYKAIPVSCKKTDNVFFVEAFILAINKNDHFIS